jgi:hypothetical protein
VLARRIASVCVAALCLLGWFSPVAPEQAVAQDQSGTPSPERLWEAYPLYPTPDPRAEPTVASSPASDATSGRRATGTATAGTDGGPPAGLLILLALIPAGGTLAFLWTRRRRENEPQAATAPVAVAPGVPPLWHEPLASAGAAKRFSPMDGVRASRAGKRFSRTDGVRASRAAAIPGAAAATLVGDVLEADMGASGPAPASPPDRHRAWTAEIEWRHTHAESRFCVVARSRGTGKTAVAQSLPLEWPPTGPDSVQALTDAAEDLEASLVAAGWKTLTPGRAWYSKRFAWEPVDAAADRAGAPAGSELDTEDAGWVQRFRRVMSVSRPPGAERPVGRGKVPVAAVLGLIVAVAILGLLLGGSVGGDDGSGVRPPAASQTDSSRQRPAAGDAGARTGSTQARKPAARTEPAASTSKDTDLTLPVLALLGLFTIGLAIRQIRR